jgi:hypothetical protein
LVDACDRYHQQLPRLVKVVNLYSVEGGYGQQFHDRMILIDRASEGRGLWSLTNSISMLARRYPLIVSRVDPNVTRAVARYLEQLEAGSVPGRIDLRSDVVWEKPRPAPPATVTRPPSNDPQFWHERVLHLLAPDAPPGQRMSAAILHGLLEPEAAPRSTTWRVPDSARAAVTSDLVQRVFAVPGAQLADIRAIAAWAYSGGPQASDYAFDEQSIESLVGALREWLEQHPAPSAYRGSPFDLTMEDSAPELLDQVRLCVNQNAPGDLLFGQPAPDFHFLAEALWALAADRLIALADETKSGRIAGWLAANVGRLSAAQRCAILGSNNGRLRALGAAILWDRNAERNQDLKSRLEALAEALGEAGVDPKEVFLMSAVLVAEEARTVEDLRDGFRSAVSRLSGAIDEQVRDRLPSVLGFSGRHHPVVRVAALASEWAERADRSAFADWCIAEVVRHLPRQGHEASVPDNASPQPSDALVRAAYAESLWDLHSADAPARYLGDVLDALDFGGANAPLYPTRDFSGWSAHLDGLLWGLQLAVAVVEHAPGNRRSDASRELLPRIRQRLNEFRAGLWHRYLDANGSLGELVDALARWTDEPTAPPEDVDALDAMFARAVVPGIWRLRATIGSRSLADRHMADLPVWAASIGSSPSMCSRQRRAASAEGIRRNLTILRDARPGDEATLKAVRSALDAWWNRF